LLEYLKKFAMTHIAYLVIIGLALVAFHSWQTEHDARLLASQQEKVAESQVTDLQRQITATNAVAAKQVQVITKIVRDVQTPTQAIAAIPQLTTAQLNPTPAPAPNQVSVDAIPLVQVLAQAKQDSIELGACQSNETADQAIIEQKQTEIAALKKKPSFWHRVGGTLKTVGIGVGIGLVIGSHAI
jgi:hypothetical protein